MAHQQAISFCHLVPAREIQSQHICLYLSWKSFLFKFGVIRTFKDLKSLVTNLSSQHLQMMFLVFCTICTLLNNYSSSYRFPKEFTSLKVNYDKSEICGIGSKKGAIRAFSQLRPIDLLNDSVRILGYHSYNTDLAFERNFSDTISNISNVLNLWSLWGLSLLGRVVIFKTLGFSKIQYLAAMSEVPTKVIDELNAIQNRFIWKHSTTKIKHSTLIADYENGGIRNVDIPTKLKALNLTWVRRLRDDNHHLWKITPSRHLSLPNGESIFVKNFKCNSYLIKKLDSLPSFYKALASYWSEASYSAMNHVEILLTESLWYNTNVKINNSTVLYKEFA